MDDVCYEEYPFSLVFQSLAITFLSYLTGTLLLYVIFGLFLGLLYLFLCAISLLLSIRFRCCYCYYYGKRCSTGLGITAKIFFKKGDASDFSNKKYVGIVAPVSFFVLLSPIIISFIYMFIRFSWTLLLLFMIYFLIAFFLGFSFRKTSCEHCCQGRIDCPAYRGMQGK